MIIFFNPMKVCVKIKSDGKALGVIQSCMSKEFWHL